MADEVIEITVRARPHHRPTRVAGLAAVAVPGEAAATAGALLLAATGGDTEGLEAVLGTCTCQETIRAAARLALFAAAALLPMERAAFRAELAARLRAVHGISG